MNLSPIQFKQRWREELLATSKEGILVFELTVGSFHMYFPDKERWKTCVPAWALDKWEQYLSACTTWCSENNIPMSIVPDAHVTEEKPGK